MAILWCGGEEVDFLTNGTLANCGGYRTGYARTALCYNGWPTQMTKSNPFPGGAVTSCWLGFQMYHTGDRSNAYLHGFGKAGCADGLVIRIGSPTTLQLAKLDGTILASWTSWPVGGVRAKYDMQLTSLQDTVNGNCKVYYNGGTSPVLEYTGNLTSGSFTSTDCVVVGGCDSSDGAISEIIVADQDTRPMSLVTLAPSAAGDANAWSGAYTDIDEVAKDDADLISSGTDAQDAQFNLNDIPSGSFQVKALKMAARAMKGSGSPVGTLKLGVKSGGTVDVDAGQAVTTSWVTYERLAATINGAALTPALLNALQVNYRSAT